MSRPCAKRFFSPRKSTARSPRCSAAPRRSPRKSVVDGGVTTAPQGGDVERRVILYTDGACSGNPGPGGWAAILIHPATGKRREISGAERLTTNNRMELIAAIEGLALRRPSAVEVFSDSRYVVQGMNEWIHDWIRVAGRRPRRSRC